MLAACLCCRKKVPKNELLGLEGMVKLKNPDDPVCVVVANGPSVNGGGGGVGSNSGVSADPNVSASVSFENEKRVSNAPHRSLPDIPVSEPHTGDATTGPNAGAGADNGSDLYATVGDKGLTEKERDRSLASHIRKLASISQHSSISQADDVSSPYARVKSMTNHAYDKLRTAEHPYAQVAAATSPAASTSAVASTSGTAVAAATNGAGSAANGHTKTGVGGSLPVDSALQQAAVATSSSLSGDDGSSRRGSSESLLGGGGAAAVSHENIAAASAIAGRVSASQELPYMTPPIVQQLPPPMQHFSGDSQDSSKGYTSISVREPLANIIAQTNQQNAQQRRRDMTDSHYATVSDDSDEMYAAIEDPNSHADLYTSGSETYAQIQPPPTTAAAPVAAASVAMVVPITVAVEINTVPSTMATPASSLTPLGRLAIVDEDVLSSSLNASTSKRQSVVSGHGDDYTITSISPASNTATAATSTPIPPNVDSLRTVHSRQASSSSCTSSVGNLGSPKPEKRQANSPLPPTPKNTSSTSGGSGQSGGASLLGGGSTTAGIIGGASVASSARSSVASCMELQQPLGSASSRHVSRENLAATDAAGGLLLSVQARSQSRLSMVSMSDGGGGRAHEEGADGASKKRNSAKNLEGMYAKVMKKNKLSNAPSQNTSPVPYRKSYNDSVTIVDHHSSHHHGHHPPSITLPAVPTVDSVTTALSRSLYLGGSGGGNDYETIDQRQGGGSAGNVKDPEYETIPADVTGTKLAAAAAAAAQAQQQQQQHKRMSSGTAAGLLAHGIQRVSHNSLTIFNEMANSTAPTSAAPASTTTTTTLGGRHHDQHDDDDDNEPGYESLPDQHRIVRSSDPDPGYETLHAAANKKQSQLHRNPSSSDYDPNYEVLRHNNNTSNNNNNNSDGRSDAYAKVWSSTVAAVAARLDDENQLNDGYSSIRSAEKKPTSIQLPAVPPALPAVSSPTGTKPPYYHDYAQIGERSQQQQPRQFQLGATVAASIIVPDMSLFVSPDVEDPNAADLYARITTVVEQHAALAARNSSDDPNYSTIPETTTTSTARPTPSTLSARGSIGSLLSATSTTTTNVTTASTTPSDNSSITPIEYTSMRSSASATLNTSATSATATPTTPPPLPLDALLMQQQHQHTYDSLTGSESDPNYESVRFATTAAAAAENPYERLYSKVAASTVGQATGGGRAAEAPVVDDYFQV